MPSESDRPIEKQLRDYAARRRDAAGKDAFALHPVTRNALQVEVEREFGRQARFGGPHRSWLNAWWPRLALGGGALAVMTLLAITLIPRGGQDPMGDLAKADKEAELAAAPALSGGAGKSVAGDVALEMRAQSESPALVADPVPAVGQRQEFKFTTRQLPPIAAAPTPARTASAPSATAPTSIANEEPARRDAVALQRQASAVASLAGSHPVPLQGSFQVVIVEDRISLVDADQSSYTGRLEPIDPASAGAAGRNRSLTFDERYYKFVQNGIEQVVPLAAQFVLTGTNRASRLPVQIVGQMVTRTQAVPAQVAVSSKVQAVPTPPAVFLQITATATESGAAPVQIDASTQPQ